MRANDQSYLSIPRLREALSYDPETGHLTWLIPGRAKGGGGRNWPGKRAGSLKPSGYVAINLDGVRYRAHRLAWMLMTGEAPTMQIDHINGKRDDNRWANLRLADQQQNSANMMRHGSLLGVKGVSRYENPSTGVVRFRAHITVDYRVRFLGSFRTLEEAKAAYRTAAEEAFGEFARAA